ncbi:MAG: hypothetical protein HYY96_12130 [Candidatus Tectomicrobia bacterium]|nr:hypothetical protein [Candidatus Tectomicrobia bacterium]
MRRIAITQAEVNLVLAKAAEDETGRVLCAEGTVLSANLIRLLTNRGVVTLYVEGEDEQAKSPEQLLRELDERFSLVETDPLMEQVKALFRRRIVEGTLTH